MESPELLAAAVGAGPDLGSDAPVRKRDHYLAIAAAAGFVEPVAALLAAGASARARDRPWLKDGPTALMLSARGGHIEVVRRLLRAGADIMAFDCRGWSALRFAADAGHAAVVRLLLDEGAVDIAGNKGFLTFDGDAEWNAMTGQHWEAATVLGEGGRSARPNLK